jgi:prephenate dehydratase
VSSLAYLGPAGTFNEQAALRFDPGADHTPQPSHTAVVAAVRDGRVDRGVAAIENSLDGPVTETTDALIQSEGVYICAELVLPIEHNLIAAPETAITDIDIVMSHPSALGQCRAFLERELPQARLEAALSTAAAVAVAVKTPRMAAIGNRRAAELTGGRILRQGIQDASLNKTRFVILDREDAAASGDDKTSIAFTVTHDRPGTLLGVLRELSERSINMTRIESRPSREGLGIYVFLVDFQGHRSDPLVEQALAAVREQAHYFRLLGSYPRFHEPA